MVNTCNKPEWLSLWMRDGRDAFLRGKQADPRSAGFVLDEIKIGCRSSDRQVQMKALSCWRLWINDQTDWKENRVCFQAVEPLTLKKFQAFHNCPAELHLKRLELFCLLIDKVGSFVACHEGPAHIAERILESCLILLSWKELDEQVRFAIIKFLKMIFSLRKKTDGEKVSAAATMQMTEKLFGRLLDKFLQTFPTLWEKSDDDKTDFICLWTFVLELSERYFESVSVLVWHEIMRLVRRVCSDRNGKFLDRLTFLHESVTTLKSVMNNSKYLDLNNVGTTPSQEWLSQLVDMCSRNDEKCKGTECFMLCVETCRILTENVVYSVGDVGMCTSILNRLDEMPCKTCLWGLWTGVLDSFRNPRSLGLHPEAKNILYRKLRGTAVNFVLDVVDLNAECIRMIESKISGILECSTWFSPGFVRRSRDEEGENEGLCFEPGNFESNMQNDLAGLATRNLSLLNFEKNVFNCTKFVLRRLQIFVSPFCDPRRGSNKRKLVSDGFLNTKELSVRENFFRYDCNRKKVKSVSFDGIEFERNETCKLAVRMYDLKTDFFRLRMYIYPFSDCSHVRLHELYKSLRKLNKNSNAGAVRQKQNIIYDRIKKSVLQYNNVRRSCCSRTDDRFQTDDDYFFLQILKSLYKLLERKIFRNNFRQGSKTNIGRETNITEITNRKTERNGGDSSSKADFLPMVVKNNNRKRKRQDQQQNFEIVSKNFKFDGLNIDREKIGIDSIKTNAEAKITTPPFRNCILKRIEECDEDDAADDRAASVRIEEVDLKLGFVELFDDPSKRTNSVSDVSVINAVESDRIVCADDREKRIDTKTELKDPPAEESPSTKSDKDNHENGSSIRNRASRMLALISNSNSESFINHFSRRKNSTNGEKTRSPKTSYIKTSRATRLLALIPPEGKNSTESSPVEDRSFDRKSCSDISKNPSNSMIATNLIKSPAIAPLGKTTLSTPPKKKSLRFDEDRNEYMIFFTDSPPTESSRKFRRNGSDGTIEYR